MIDTIYRVRKVRSPLRGPPYVSWEVQNMTTNKVVQEFSRKKDALDFKKYLNDNPQIKKYY
jgi:hypothetical protein